MRPEVYYAWALVSLAVVDMVVLARMSRRIRSTCWIDALSRLVEEQIVQKHLLPRLPRFPARQA